MKKIFISAAMVLFISSICFAQGDEMQLAVSKAQAAATQDSANWGKTVSGLRCKIQTDKKVYKVGDEIVLTLTWQNITDKEVKLYYRQDQIPYQMLSFRRQDGTVPLGRLIMIEKAQAQYPVISPEGTYSLNLKGKLIKETLKEPWIIKHQKESGNLILKFDGQLLGEFPILLAKPDNFYVSFYYTMPADSYLASKDANIWTGEVQSGEISFEVKER
jgi:hypothetical protein